MTGLEIFAVGAVAGVASKWGFDRYILKKVRWPSWRGEDSTSGTIIMEDLKKITGIGPAYAGQLNKAGILNYADLAAQTPERVQEIVSSAGVDETTSWIAQAKALAEGTSEPTDELPEAKLSVDAEIAQSSATAI